ncbi:hypothetical protein QJQ45_021086, partial [Haematococcus lacustris]
GPLASPASAKPPLASLPQVISGKLYAGPEVDVWSCGVILYALLCGSLPFDDENIPNLFKKIKGGIYTLPSHLSPGARDIIPRMLLVDPLKRITIPEIRQHPWFTLHLPRYLAVMQAEAVVRSPRVDEEMVGEVVRLGFERDLLVDSLRTRQQNKATVTYYLMSDNRRRLPSSGYLSAELSEVPGTTSAAPLPSSQGGYGAGAGHGAGGAAGGAPSQRVLAERRWRLGVHARGHPSALMAELLRVLQAAGIAWKKIGPYNVKCRKMVQLQPFGSGQMSDDGDEDRLDGMDTTSSPPGASASLAHPATAHPHRHHPPAHPCPPSHPGHGPPMQHGHNSVPNGPGSQPASQSSQQQGAGQGGGQEQGTPAGAAHEGVGGGLEGEGQSGVLHTELKFECQVYKVREEEYMIDVQRLCGDVFIYLEVTGRVLADMRV